MKKKFLQLIIIVIACVLLLNGCSSKSMKNKAAPVAVNGIMDLTNWDLNSDNIVNLDGEWEFYYSQLLKYGDFQSIASSNRNAYINVPGSWNKDEIDGNKLSGSGYATYRLILNIGDHNDSILGLKIPRIFTSYSIWADGKLLGSNGLVGVNKDSTIPQYKPQVIMLQPTGDTIQLIVQVSNFSHRSGGILESIKMGSGQKIINAKENQLALELFLFGCLFIIGIYHIVLYLFRKKYDAPLYFGLYCIFIAIRTLFVGEIFITQLFPNFNWEVQHKIQTLTFYIGVPVFVMFINSLFPSEFPKRVLKASKILAVLFSLLVLTTPARIFNVVNPIYQIIVATTIVFVIYSLIMACIKKIKGAFAITLGGIIFIITVINDMLFLSVPFNDYNIPFLKSIIVTGNLSSFGLIILVLSQSLILAMNFSRAFSQVEEMSEKLIIADKQKDMLLTSLELKVKERTLELEHSNIELGKAFTDLARIEQSRKRLFSNISHDLRTPMTLIQGYSEAILDDVVSSKEDQHKYLKLIQNKIIGLTRLTDDLFELSQLESRHKKLQLELTNISIFMSRIESKYRYDVENASLVFTLNAPENSDILINIDTNQFERVFSNLIYNALKFTSEGSITVSCDIINEQAIFKVTDTGCGIKEQELPNIFDRFYTASKSRNSSMKSSGLGLAIAKEIVEYHEGKMWVESKLNQGSSFYFTIGIQKAV